MNWLAKLSEVLPTDEEELEQSIADLPNGELLELAFEEGAAERPTQVESLQEKIAAVRRIGASLARERGSELLKLAMLPSGSGSMSTMQQMGGNAGKAMGVKLKPPKLQPLPGVQQNKTTFGNVTNPTHARSQSLEQGAGTTNTVNSALVSSGIPKQAFIGALAGLASKAPALLGAAKAAKTVIPAVAKAAPTLMGTAGKVMNSAPMKAYNAYGTGKAIQGATQANVQRFAAPAGEAASNFAVKAAMVKLGLAGAPAAGGLGGMVRSHPMHALGAAGAGLGAMMAPTDQQGNKDYLPGAVIGGGLALGAGHLMGGAEGVRGLADKWGITGGAAPETAAVPGATTAPVTPPAATASPDPSAHAANTAQAANAAAPPGTAPASAQTAIPAERTDIAHQFKARQAEKAQAASQAHAQVIDPAGIRPQGTAVGGRAMGATPGGLAQRFDTGVGHQTGAAINRAGAATGRAIVAPFVGAKNLVARGGGAGWGAAKAVGRGFAGFGRGLFGKAVHASAREFTPLQKVAMMNGFRKLGAVPRLGVHPRQLPANMSTLKISPQGVTRTHITGTPIGNRIPEMEEHLPAIAPGHVQFTPARGGAAAPQQVQQQQAQHVSARRQPPPIPGAAMGAASGFQRVPVSEPVKVAMRKLALQTAVPLPKMYPAFGKSMAAPRVAAGAATRQMTPVQNAPVGGGMTAQQVRGRNMTVAPDPGVGRLTDLDQTHQLTPVAPAPNTIVKRAFARLIQRSSRY